MCTAETRCYQCYLFNETENLGEIELRPEKKDVG